MNPLEQNHHVRSMPALRGIMPQLIQTAKAVEGEEKAEKAKFLTRWLKVTGVKRGAVISIEKGEYSERYVIRFSPRQAGDAKLVGGVTQIHNDGTLSHTYTEYQLDLVEDSE
jgi:hypothetical protein